MPGLEGNGFVLLLLLEPMTKLDPLFRDAKACSALDLARVHDDCAVVLQAQGPGDW